LLHISHYLVIFYDMRSEKLMCWGENGGFLHEKVCLRLIFAQLKV